jgi:hypothetical protein
MSHLVFHCLFIYICIASYQDGRLGIPLTSLTQPQCCACSKPEPAFPTSYVMVFLVFSELMWEVIVHFVDYHYSNFLFIRHITLISSQPVFIIVLLNAEYLVEEQQILILLSLTWACLNSSALEVSMLRIAALMQFVTYAISAHHH